MGSVTQFRRQGFREGTGSIYYGYALRRLLLGPHPRRTWRVFWLVCFSLGVAYGVVKFTEALQ